MKLAALRRLALALLAAPAAFAQVIPVSDVAGLQQAIASAQPGHEIVLADGVYVVNANLNCTVAGTALAPIVLRAATSLGAQIRFNALEGFRVSAPHWRFEDLDIVGVCADHNDCEHAFHLFGKADHSVIRGNRLRDFNAQIKSNGADQGAGFVFPDDVLVEFNEFFDSAPRQTANPVTKIDVVGGRRWILRGNTIYDYEKAQGNQISYAAFLKGGSRDGLIERNLVICERHFPGGTRVGLSLGGGGTAPDAICEAQSCTPEHIGGLLRNNIVLNCPAIGIYINAGQDTRIHHNIVYATPGIDLRFASTSADLRNNLVSGPIRNRDGSSHTQSGNLQNLPAVDFASWFEAPDAADFRLRDGSAVVDLGVAVADVPDDFCGSLRSDGLPDRGAIEFAATRICHTEVGGGLLQEIGTELFADGFEADAAP